MPHTADRTLTVGHKFASGYVTTAVVTLELGDGVKRGFMLAKSIDDIPTFVTGYWDQWSLEENGWLSGNYFMPGSYEQILEKRVAAKTNLTERVSEYLERNVALY